MEKELAKNKGTKKEGKPGAFSDPAYVGPQYASWSEQDPSTKLYSAILQDSPVQAWLVYLMYQKSSKTFDPREQARRKDATEEAKQRAAANAAKRKEQSAQREAKMEKDRADRKRAAEEERDAALAEANEQSRRAAQNDLPEGGGSGVNDEDLMDLLGDGPADAPVPASAEDDDDDDEMPANADPAENPDDALMRMLNDALNDD
jgi:flagellar biosynthesis GTPase FlhF